MPHNRFFINQPLKTHQELEITDDEFHHISRVMRGKAGDQIDLVNGKGLLAKAEITSLNKSSVRCKVLSTSQEEKRANRLILALSLIKLPRLEVAIEKCVELGVTDFVLFAGKLSDKKELSNNQVRRLNTLLISALKQSGRLHLPTLEFYESLFKLPDIQATKYFGDLKEDKHFAKQTNFNNLDLCFFVGPESGFTDLETQHLLKTGAKPLNFHQNILRAETAAIFIASIAS